MSNYDKEIIIKKCFGIASFVHARGEAALAQKFEKYSRYDTEIDNLIKKLVEYVKNES